MCSVFRETECKSWIMISTTFCMVQCANEIIQRCDTYVRSCYRNLELVKEMWILQFSIGATQRCVLFAAVVCSTTYTLQSRSITHKNFRISMFSRKLQYMPQEFYKQQIQILLLHVVDNRDDLKNSACKYNETTHFVNLKHSECYLLSKTVLKILISSG